MTETQGIVKQADLQQMKNEAIFVNTSRAELEEREGLVNALLSGR